MLTSSIIDNLLSVFLKDVLKYDWAELIHKLLQYKRLQSGLMKDVKLCSIKCSQGYIVLLERAHSRLLERFRASLMKSKRSPSWSLLVGKLLQKFLRSSNNLAAKKTPKTKHHLNVNIFSKHQTTLANWSVLKVCKNVSPTVTPSVTSSW